MSRHTLSRLWLTLLFLHLCFGSSFLHLYHVSKVVFLNVILHQARSHIVFSTTVSFMLVYLLRELLYCRFACRCTQKGQKLVTGESFSLMIDESLLYYMTVVVHVYYLKVFLFDTIKDDVPDIDSFLYT